VKLNSTLSDRLLDHTPTWGIMAPGILLVSGSKRGPQQVNTVTNRRSVFRHLHIGVSSGKLCEAPCQISVAFISDKSDCRFPLLHAKSPSTTYSSFLMEEYFRNFYLPLSYICTFSESRKLVYIGREWRKGEGILVAKKLK
jgi:hypothetical protein